MKLCRNAVRLYRIKGHIQTPYGRKRRYAANNGVRQYGANQRLAMQGDTGYSATEPGTHMIISRELVGAL